MSDQTLDNLSRDQLLALLQARQQELEELRGQLRSARAQLTSRQLVMDNAGSIAQAAMQLSGVFLSSQLAADRYLESVEALKDRREAEYRQRLDEAEQQAQVLLADAQAQCRQMSDQAREKAEFYWNSLSQRIDAYFRAHPELLQALAEDAVPSGDDTCFGPDD